MLKKKLKTICIAHSKDVDGVGSATLTKMATGAESYLVNYDRLIDVLKNIDGKSEVIVCDLGMNNRTINEFINQAERICKEGKFTYIDHHPLSSYSKKRMKKVGINLIHSTNECAGVLTYTHFKKQLPKKSALIACYAAVTDYLDDKPIARELIGSYDRQLILLESTMLAYAMAYRDARISFSKKIINDLEKFKLPHEINGVPKYAAKQANKMNELMKKIPKEGKKMGKFAFMEVENATLGLVANLLVGEFSVPVAFAYRINKETNSIEMSMRGSYNSKYNLGKIIPKIAKDLNGSGGGHSKAVGLRIPIKNKNKFLKSLKKELEKR